MNRIRLTTYLAGAIESASKDEMGNWREEVRQKLKSPDLLIYDPILQESYKVGKSSIDQVEYITNLKRAGRWDLFYSAMWKIWFGAIQENTDIIQTLQNLRMRKYIDGNRREEINCWGDSEAVVRSDFVLVYMPKDIKTVGTIYEVVFAFLFRIPIYLILPDSTKTECNSSLLFGNQISNKGEVKVFYKIDDCIKFIKETYKI